MVRGGVFFDFLGGRCGEVFRKRIYGFRLEGEWELVKDGGDIGFLGKDS